MLKSVVCVYLIVFFNVKALRAQRFAERVSISSLVFSHRVMQIFFSAIPASSAFIFLLVTDLESTLQRSVIPKAQLKYSKKASVRHFLTEEKELTPTLIPWEDRRFYLERNREGSCSISIF